MLQSQGEVGGGGEGEALCYFASTGYAAEQGTGFQGLNAFFISDVCNHSLCVIPFKTARAFTIKPLANRTTFVSFRPEAF